MKKIVILLMLSTGISATSTYQRWVKKKEELITLVDLLLEKTTKMPGYKEKFDAIVQEHIKEKLVAQSIEATDQRCKEELTRITAEINSLADTFFKNKNEPLVPSEIFFTSSSNLFQIHMLKLLFIRHILEMGEIYFLIEKINNCAKELNTIDNICLRLEKKLPELAHQL